MLLHRVSKETSGMREGEIPSPTQLFDLWRELLNLHSALGEAIPQQFSGKEKARLSRIVNEDTMFRNIRTGELKKAIRDAEGDVRLAIVEEKEREIEAAADYVLYQCLKESLERAIDYLRSLMSYVKHAESNHA